MLTNTMMVLYHNSIILKLSPRVVRKKNKKSFRKNMFGKTLKNSRYVIVDSNFC